MLASAWRCKGLNGEELVLESSSPQIYIVFDYGWGCPLSDWVGAQFGDPPAGQEIDDSHCTDSSGAPFSGPGGFVHGHSSLGHFPFRLLQCALPGAAFEYHLEAITCCQFPCEYNSKCWLSPLKLYVAQGQVTYRPVSP